MKGGVIVTATPPTTNGDLHVGHLSGPYLAADAFKRFQRLNGRPVLYVSSADDNQTYVVTTAERLGRDPRELATEFTEKIKETLLRADVDIDVFSSPDTDHARFVQDFFMSLYKAGAFVERETDHLYCPEHRRLLFESYVGGVCSICLAKTKGAICETCGHPNNAIDLIDLECPYGRDHELERKRVRTLFLPLEKYRNQIRNFYADKWSSWRPHLLHLVDELLAKPLPEFPITYVSSWGVPAPFPGYGDQVINVWAEMLPGLIRSTRLAASKVNSCNADLWLEDSGCELVQFLGYDNSFFFAIVHLSLLFAARPRTILPAAIITNEFYNLDNFKFSTSLGHAIWARDLLNEYSSDQVRFYLSLSNPENQQTNFTLTEMKQLSCATLIDPWERLVKEINRSVDIGPITGDLSDETAAAIEVFISQMNSAFTTRQFSLRRGAERISRFVSWMADYAERLHLGEPANRHKNARGVNGLWCGMRAISIAVDPIMPRFAHQLRELLGVSCSWASLRDRTQIRTAPIPAGILARTR